ncbi:hypothetical protein [Thiothrix sp.]|jgi:hypothetical protein|uniref:hypothetical protein n=1 Tax=Thiothrix sp. TaxID=1032 RepID=UPI00257F502B|nr:hypothetical protein [Thiothrix sp.]
MSEPPILYTAQLAKTLGKTTEALRALIVRDPQSIPPPKGKIGRRPYWLPDDVQKWLENGGKPERKRGRPRLVPAHINIASV